MNISEDLQLYIGEQLSLGNYESLDEIITEALTLLRNKRQAELHEQIDIGRRQIENGECTVLSTETEVHEFFEKIKNRKHTGQAEPAALTDGSSFPTSH